MKPRHRPFPLALPLTIAAAIALWACSSAPPGGATASPTVEPSATASTPPGTTPTPGVGATDTPTGTAGARDLLTEEEVAAFLGEAIDATSFGGFTLKGISRQDGWDFAGVDGGYLTVVLVPDSEAGFQEAKAAWTPTTDVTGVGDAAFVTQGAPPIVMAALRGTTAVYLYTSEADATGALKTLLATALGRL